MGDTDETAGGSGFELSGGALCLDFVNTLGDRPRCRNEQLGRYGDLLRWGEEAGLLGARRRRELEQRASRRPARARAAFRRALDLRETLYRIFSARARGRAAGPRDLAALNRALGEALPHSRLEQGPEGFRWGWGAAEGRGDRLVWPILRSAADLLTGPELVHVRECASDRCSWLFVDRSRTRRRRWCDMKTCGNRAKARRHYARTKGRSRAGLPTSAEPGAEGAGE